MPDHAPVGLEEREEQERDGACRPHCRQGIRTEKPADDHGIRQIVRLLEQIADQQRQRKNKHTGPPLRTRRRSVVVRTQRRYFTSGTFVERVCWHHFSGLRSAKIPIFMYTDKKKRTFFQKTLSFPLFSYFTVMGYTS